MDYFAALWYGLLHDQVVWALIASSVLLTLADLVTGVTAAIRNKTFKVEMVADFIQTHVVGRVLPISILAVLGHFEAPLALLAATAAGAYAVETLGSIRESLMLPKEPPPDEMHPDEVARRIT